MTELAGSLERFGHPYALLTFSEGACDELPALYCVTDGLLRHAKGAREDVVNLWVLRFHAAARLSTAGVGVTVLDADCVVTRPFLPTLVALERKYALVVLREGPANGGTWHLRASAPSGAALWIIRQIERLTLLFTRTMVHSAADNVTAGLQDPGAWVGVGVLL